jgi:hypothetical protein
LGNLKPNEPLIYERANGVVYARYANDSTIPRWIVGGDPGAVARAQGNLVDYSEWMRLCDLCETNTTLKKLMDKLVTTYYIVKDGK